MCIRPVPKPSRKPKAKKPKRVNWRNECIDLAMRYARARAGNRSELSQEDAPEGKKWPVHHVFGRDGNFAWLPENLICITHKEHSECHSYGQSRKMKMNTKIRDYFGPVRWQFLEDESRKIPAPINWKAVYENLSSLVAWVAAGKHAQRECFCVPPDSESIPQGQPIQRTKSAGGSR